MTCPVCAKHTCLDECLDWSETKKNAAANDLVFRLKERARIRRQIPSRKSVQEGKPDRISDLLEEAAMFIERNT
jgi:hypothetical protein